MADIMTEPMVNSVPIPASQPSPQPSVAQRSNTPASTPAVNRGYGHVVLDHFINPRNVGSFDIDDQNVGTAVVGTVDQGAVIQLQIRVDESGIISGTCFKAYGCGATIATASWLTEWAKGKSCDQASGLRNTELIRALSLPPVKTHCAILAEDAIKAAVDNYTQNRSNQS